MLELAILGLLKERAMHGYELKQELTRKLGHFWQVSYGSLYPALRDLHRRGAIEPVFDAEGTSRRKNVYRVTPQGEGEFLELIEDPASTSWEEEKFPLRFAFFRYVAPEIRLRLLQRRRAYLTEKLEDLRTSLTEDGDRIDGYTRSLIRHGLEATSADIDWLDELIAAERRTLADEEPGAGEDSEADADDGAAAPDGAVPGHVRDDAENAPNDPRPTETEPSPAEPPSATAAGPRPTRIP